MQRIARVLVVAGLTAASLAVAGGGQVASGQTGPVGYSIGQHFSNGSDECQFFSIDLSTGATTQISDPSGEVRCGDGLTFAADGTLYAYVNSELEGVPTSAELVTIDPATGVQTTVGELPPVGFGNGGMTFDAAGNLWLYGRTFASDPDCADFTACLWQVDPATGDATFVAEAPPNVTVTGLAGDCSEVLALVQPLTTGNPNAPRVETLDTATGEVSEILAVNEMGQSTGLDFDANGALWALGGKPFTGIGSMQVANIDLATGDITYQTLFIDGDPQEPFSGFLDGLAVSPISCPVPPPPPPPAPAPEVVLAPTFTG
jgi:hypothetical protein